MKNLLCILFICSFRKHFAKSHGYEPSAEHVKVRSISAARNETLRRSSGSEKVDFHIHVFIFNKQYLYNHNNYKMNFMYLKKKQK